MLKGQNFLQMKIVEALKMGAELLKFMSRNDIYIDDWKYIDAYEQFCRMRELGVKYDNAIDELAKNEKLRQFSHISAFGSLCFRISPLSLKCCLAPPTSSVSYAAGSIYSCLCVTFQHYTCCNQQYTRMNLLLRLPMYSYWHL